MYEDGGAEESGDGVRTERLHRSRDLSHAGGGGHLQGPGEEHATPANGDGKNTEQTHLLTTSCVILLFRF